VGPLVGVAIITLLIWALYSRRQRQYDGFTDQVLIAEGYTHHQTAYTKPQLQYGNASQGTHEYQSEIHEVHANHSSQDPFELPGPENVRPR
jgi:hypothetical protein